MGLEFSFDEISLDQKVSSEQLEIDLYDELVTISDAEPEEQVRLLAVKPAVAVHHEGDKPESIRITGSLGREHSLAGVPIPTAPQQTEIPVAAPPGNAVKSGPLPVAYPPPLAAAPELPVTSRPLNGQTAGAVQAPVPSPRTKETRPPQPAQPPAAAPPKSPPLPAPIPPAPARVDTASTEASAGACPDCGSPASELDMICIECGAFIG